MILEVGPPRNFLAPSLTLKSQASFFVCLLFTFFRRLETHTRQIRNPTITLSQTFLAQQILFFPKLKYESLRIFQDADLLICYCLVLFGEGCYPLGVLRSTECGRTTTHHQAPASLFCKSTQPKNTDRRIRIRCEIYYLPFNNFAKHVLLFQLFLYDTQRSF